MGEINLDYKASYEALLKLLFAAFGGDEMDSVELMKSVGEGGAAMQLVSDNFTKMNADDMMLMCKSIKPYIDTCTVMCEKYNYFKEVD